MSLVDDLIKYKQENIIRFHMPGHKGHTMGFENLEKLRQNLFEIDVTEVEGTDNLHVPTGIIKNAMERAKDFYRCGNSFFIVNGSTAGIYSMILGLLKPKDKIIIQRNCHRSVFSACLLLDLEVRYINPSIDKELNIPVSIKTDEVIKILDENKDAKAILLTYPTYYGTCFDLKKVINEARKRGVYVLIDAAHGAHLILSESLPDDPIMLGADAAVYSLHKTTPALTQCSILNVRDGVDVTGIKFMLSVFQTTSPSYVFMSSIDLAIDTMNRYGSELIEKNICYANRLRNRLKNSKYNVVGLDRIGKFDIFDIDSTRLVISCNLGGILLDNILREKYKIQVEMADSKNIVLIGTMFDKEEYYDILYRALMDIQNKYEFNSKYDIFNINIDYKQRINMRSAYYGNKERIPFKNSIGRISAEMIVPYPPGVPILMPGEEITDEIIEAVNMMRGKVTLNGISDKDAEFIYVIKED